MCVCFEGTKNFFLHFFFSFGSTYESAREGRKKKMKNLYNLRWNSWLALCDLCSSRRNFWLFCGLCFTWHQKTFHWLYWILSSSRLVRLKIHPNSLSALAFILKMKSERSTFSSTSSPGPKFFSSSGITFWLEKKKKEKKEKKKKMIWEFPMCNWTFEVWCFTCCNSPSWLRKERGKEKVE